MKLYIGDCCIPLVRNGDWKKAQDGGKGKQEKEGGNLAWIHSNVTPIFSKRRSGGRGAKKMRGVVERRCSECGRDSHIMDTPLENGDYLCEDCYPLVMEFGNRDMGCWRGTEDERDDRQEGRVKNSG